MRGSVNKIEFRVLSKEFESIETSPRLARFLEENLASLSKITNIFHDVSSPLPRCTVKWWVLDAQHSGKWGSL